MAVEVVDGFNPVAVEGRATEQHRAGAEERLYVVGRVAKALPDFGGNGALTAEVGEGGFERCHGCTSSASAPASSATSRANACIAGASFSAWPGLGG